ncbi:hypothetical protein JY651_14545 [Pyxidicoccus parkwayensis]|uniref:Phospholipase C/D domain-containing protein n=1 Tax=Pyxidicoccus parkwayensis TaxID=2813578 RepID=A0ABX7P6E3_9BACT|nr:MFS transporter [Pyxidicoccus parkwaysis]QSQ26064.1 hypothetical protein JY651_14545 [Pyxidicoccus parkwaysis]
MPAVLTHKTIMLLARERLANIRDTLRRKLDSGNTVTDLEFRLWYLADRAHRLMSENAGAVPAINYPTDTAVYATPLGQGVSRFSVMGSMGPDIPAFAALFAKGQGWVFDTVHKGNPDSNREPVVAKTTSFALELWTQVRRAVSEGRATEDQARLLAGYVLGHLCHVAGDVISHPYINDLEWHQNYGVRGKFSHEGGEGTIDAKVAQQVLLRGSTREGQDWDVWWPTVDEVPGAFFAAYVDAMEQVYSARTARPVGFGGFEAEFLEHDPPSLTVDFIRDGYSFYRNAVLAMGYGWGAWRWFFFLTPLMLPLMSVVPLMAAMPHARQFFERKLGDVEERAWFEALTLPMTLALIPTAFYGIWLAALTTKGVEGLHAAGLATTGLSAILAITFFATLGSDPPSWVRWGIVFGVWGLATGVFTVKGLVDMGTDRKARGALGLVYGLPFIFAVIGLVLMLIVGVFRLIGPEVGLAVFIILALVVAGLLIWQWIDKAFAARDARIPEQPKPFPADRPHFVRVFDDSTLWSLPGGDPTALDRLHYPSGERVLLKLWWEGTGELYVRSEQSRLDFSFTGIGEPARTIEAPIAPMSAREYAEYLNQTFVGPGGQTQKLRAALYHPTDGEREYPLPTGATFKEDHPQKRITAPLPTDVWHKLGTTQDNTEYVLHHSDKPYQSVRFGTKGPVDSPAPEDDGAKGEGVVMKTSGTVVTGLNTGFEFFFDEGDQIEIEGQVRTVTRIVNERELWVDNAFNPAITSSKEYARVGPHLEHSDGYTYVTNPRVPPGVVGGPNVMDLAADLGALLCLGMTPHLLSDADRSVPELQGRNAAGTGTAVDPRVSKVYQVFRNWSLDRRRLNEWRMLVAGGARSDKGGNAALYDPALPPRDPAWVPPRAPLGEPVSNTQGWVPMLREWLDRASRNTNMADPLGSAPGNPSHQDLSRALAYLLDLPEPVALQ